MILKIILQEELNLTSDKLKKYKHDILFLYSKVSPKIIHSEKIALGVFGKLQKEYIFDFNVFKFFENDDCSHLSDNNLASLLLFCINLYATAEHGRYTSFKEGTSYYQEMKNSLIQCLFFVDGSNRPPLNKYIPN